MKKMLFVGALVIAAIVPGINSMAEEGHRNEGSIEGLIDLYMDDISYLENEINKLLIECEGGISNE